MTREQVRQLLTERFSVGFAEAFPGVPVEYENREQVDLEKQAGVGPFAEFEVHFTDTEQVGFGNPRLERTLGFVRVIVNAPAGSGVARMNEIETWAHQNLSNWQSGGLLTFGSRAEKVGDLKGFVSRGLRVFFQADSYTLT